MRHDISVTLICPRLGLLECEVEDASFCKLRTLCCAETAELIYLNDGRVMMIDEDGIGKGVPYNMVATAIVEEHNPYVYMPKGILGTVVIVSEMDLDSIPYKNENGE